MTLKGGKIFGHKIEKNNTKNHEWYLTSYRKMKHEFNNIRLIRETHLLPIMMFDTTYPSNQMTLKRGNIINHKTLMNIENISSI